MIFSENRYPLFRIMLQAGSEYRPCEAGPQADRVPILTIGYRKIRKYDRRDSGYPSTDSRSGVHSLVRIESEVQPPRRFRMALQAHLVELERKHKILENELHEALVHLSTDDLQIVELKRRKLMVKDEIERLKHTVGETLH
jgi:hypothetical protein